MKKNLNNSPREKEVPVINLEVTCQKLKEDIEKKDVAIKNMENLLRETKLPIGKEGVRLSIERIIEEKKNFEKAYDQFILLLREGNIMK